MEWIGAPDFGPLGVEHSPTGARGCRCRRPCDAAAEAWSIRPERPIHWLEVIARAPRLGAVRRPKGTPIWKLEAALKCRSCRKGRYAPPVHMIKLTQSARSRPMFGYIRTMMIDEKGELEKAYAHVQTVTC